mmetsp:Transcript_1175/g.2799  ORF Transcript_1175/g.2799 Transcript_1175/m.2799 type:complete len:259 (+) Transcript_1175:406-1182(+)
MPMAQASTEPQVALLPLRAGAREHPTLKECLPCGNARHSKSPHPHLHQTRAHRSSVRLSAKSSRPKTCTPSSACHGTQAKWRSKKPTASSPCNCILTRTAPTTLTRPSRPWAGHSRASRILTNEHTMTAQGMRARRKRRQLHPRSVPTPCATAHGGLQACTTRRSTPMRSSTSSSGVWRQEHACTPRAKRGHAPARARLTEHAQRTQQAQGRQTTHRACSSTSSRSCLCSCSLCSAGCLLLVNQASRSPKIAPTTQTR